MDKLFKICAFLGASIGIGGPALGLLMLPLTTKIINLTPIFTAGGFLFILLGMLTLLKDL